MMPFDTHASYRLDRKCVSAVIGWSSSSPLSDGQLFFPHTSVSSTWSTSLGCTTGTPALTPAPPSATCVGRRCRGSPLMACLVKVWLLCSLSFTPFTIRNIYKIIIAKDYKLENGSDPSYCMHPLRHIIVLYCGKHNQFHWLRQVYPEPILFLSVDTCERMGFFIHYYIPRHTHTLTWMWL